MKNQSFRDVLTHSFSRQYRETAEKMRDLSWEYHYLAWSEVPMNKKKSVYRAFAYEAREDEDYFFYKTARDDYGTVFASVDNIEKINELDKEVMVNFAGAMLRRFVRNSDSVLDMIFEEQKPSVQELREVAQDEKRFWGSSYE